MLDGELMVGILEVEIREAGGRHKLSALPVRHIQVFQAPQLPNTKIRRVCIECIDRQVEHL